MPTVVLATTEFEALAKECAAHEGLEPTRLISVPHPIGGVSEDALHEKADAALEDLLALGPGTS